MNSNKHPLVSLAISTYNHERFIKETIEGALIQDYPNLEIIFSDDCSTDNTYEITKKLTKNYSGPHKVIVRQNNHNLGLVQHYNKKIFEVASGDLIIGGGGDDVLLPNSVSFAVEKLLQSDCCAISFNAYTINEDSKQTGMLCDQRDYALQINRCNNLDMDIYTIDDYIKGSFNTNGACRIMKREVLNIFGRFNDDCPTEDSTNLLRSFLFGKFGFCFTPNIKYRIHSNNISGFHNLMTRFDPSKIYAQYQKDLETAKERNLIDVETAKKVQMTIDDYLSKQIAIRKIYNKGTFIPRILCALSYLFNPHHTVSEVIWYIRQIRTW